MNEYRQNAINHLKTHLGCVGYRDYLVTELEKLDRIEQIVNKWNNDASNSFADMCKINGILKE